MLNEREVSQLLGFQEMIILMACFTFAILLGFLLKVVYENVKKISFNKLMTASIFFAAAFATALVFIVEQGYIFTPFIRWIVLFVVLVMAFYSSFMFEDTLTRYRNINRKLYEEREYLKSMLLERNKDIKK